MTTRKKFSITTWGCQMNEHDSEKISGILHDIGYIETNNREDADLIIFNTCLVRENAELKVYGHLGALKKMRKDNPNLIIAVCGCMMQRKEIRDKILNKYKHVSLIFGTHNIHELPQLLKKCQETNKTVIEIHDDTKSIIEGINKKRKYNFKAFVNVMHGCNNFCTYCIVPYTRGREISRQPEDIINEVTKLGNEGYKEVTLLGQNVNSYGKTLAKKLTFADLLYKLNDINGIERIRFMTSHPKDLSDDLIYAMRDCNKVCEHLHLPFQAGSDKILKLMNRKYTKQYYLNLINKIKNEIPNIALTTDIIVGFPGENEKDFEETLNVVKQVRYDSAFTFLYSIREGTPAAKMKNQIPDKIKHQRFQRLLDVLHPISSDINEKLKGNTLEVLVEGISKNNDEVLSGRTRTNKLVHFKGNKNLIGSLVNVKIITPKTWTLDGELI